MLEIITNNHPRELVSFYDLTEKEREDFDYVSEEEHYSPRFFRYRDSVYDAFEFQYITSTMILHTPKLVEWSGFQSDSFFSGVLIYFPAHSYDEVIVGRFYS